MCKKIVVAALLGALASINLSYAQEISTSCSVTGIVVQQGGEALQGASVKIILAKDATYSSSVTTGVNGAFEVPTGCDSFRLQVTMTGYEPYNSSVLYPKGLGRLRIELKANIQKLSTVEIRASRRPVEVRADRTIINVEAAASNVGANALEVLEKSPGISVDQDGNISMQGKQGVLLLIDGKRSQLNNAELAALLRSLSSAQIDQIELVTQPSARYDASGNAGVIHIKLKRNRSADANGSIATSITQGRYTRFNQSIALDKRLGKAALSLGYTGAYIKGFFDFSIARKLVQGPDQPASFFNQRTINPFRQAPHNIRLSMDYAFNNKTSLSLNNTLFMSSAKDAPATNGHSEIQTVKSLDKSVGRNHIRRFNYSAGANFRTLIDTTGKELLIDADFFKYDRKNNQHLYSELWDEQGQTIDNPYHIKGYNPSSIQIASGRIDYMHPLTKNWKAEGGLKYSDIVTQNMSLFTREVNGGWEPDNRGSDFKYSEGVLAGYVNLFATLKYWKGQVGLRTEATQVKAQASLSTHTRENKYMDWFPTLSLNYEKHKGKVFSMYYSRRIDRPNYQDMNPFQFIFNRYTYMQGNPALIPQYTRVLEAGYANKTAFNVKASYSYTKDVMGDAIFQDNTTYIAYQQKTNLSERHVVSLNSTVVIPVTKNWSSTVFGNLLYTSYKGQFQGTALSHNIYSFSFNINNLVRLGKDWTAELSGSYFHKNYLTALFFDQGTGFINAGIAKQVLKGKGTLRLAARDILQTQSNRYRIDFNAMDFNFKQRQDVTNITVAFTWRFGKTTAVPRRRASSAAEEMNRVGNN